MKKQLIVDPIKNGTVIDHIAAGKSFAVAEILNLKNLDNLLLIGMNLSSKKIGKKDIIKIENKILTEDEVNSIALISPDATLVVIENYEVIKKYKIKLPSKVSRHIICPNPHCITNIEEVETEFDVIKKKKVEVRCKYCEKKYGIEQVKFKF